MKNNRDANTGVKLTKEEASLVRKLTSLQRQGDKLLKECEQFVWSEKELRQLELLKPMTAEARAKIVKNLYEFKKFCATHTKEEIDQYVSKIKEMSKERRLKAEESRVVFKKLLEIAKNLNYKP